MARAKMFDNLINNRDPNLGNWLVDPAWNLILIDHTRAFAPGKDMVHKMNRIEDGRTFGVRLRTDPGPAVEAILPERKVRLT